MVVLLRGAHLSEGLGARLKKSRIGVASFGDMLIMKALLLVAIAAAQPGAQQQAGAVLQQAAGSLKGIRSGAAILSILSIGQAVSGPNGADPQKIAELLQQPGARSAMVELIQNMLAPGAIEALLQDVERSIGPLPVDVLKSAAVRASHLLAPFPACAHVPAPARTGDFARRCGAAQRDSGRGRASQAAR